MRTSLFFCAALALPCAGCDGGQGTTDGGTTTTSATTATFDYPKDGELRLNHLQAKGTHNSYHVAPEGDLIPQLMYTHAPLDV